MAHYIIHKNGAYNIYSTNVDAPLFEPAMTITQLRKYVREKYGKNGLLRLSDRLERAHKKAVARFSTAICESASKTIARARTKRP